MISDERRGFMLGVASYLIWGFAALYWVRAEPVTAPDLLAHRTLWSMPFVLLCLLVTGRLRTTMTIFRHPATVATLCVSSVLIATNWLVFLWAITHQQASEAALGYFLLPLVNVAIGVLVFRESIDTPQKLGVLFAVAALVLQLIYHGGLPLIALVLSCSFGLYGAVRMKVSVGSLEGLFIETLLMSPFALAWVVYHDGAGLGQYGIEVDLILLGAGAFTAIPLIAYVAAGRLLPLTALGLVFYIGPTAQLLVAVFAFGEPFSGVQAAAFGLVWIGLAIVTFNNMRRLRTVRRLQASASTAQE